MEQRILNVSHVPQGILVIHQIPSEILREIETLFPTLLVECSIFNTVAACNNNIGCSIENIEADKVARYLAHNAYIKVKKLTQNPGLGLCLIADEGQFHLVIQDEFAVVSKTMTPAKNNFDIKLVAAFINSAIYEVLNPIRLSFTDIENYTITTSSKTSKNLLPLFNGEEKFVYPYQDEPVPEAIFSGSWAPLTREHMYMASIAEAFCDATVYFEASIETVNKPPIDLISAEQLVKQFKEMHLILTKAPSFLEKAKLFPGVTFVVGMDTWLQIIDPEFYNYPLTEVIRQFKQLDVDFLVFGRQQGDKFMTLSDDISYGLARKVPQHVFSDNPEDDYQSEQEMRLELQKSQYKKQFERRKNRTGL